MAERQGRAPGAIKKNKTLYLAVGIATVVAIVGGIAAKPLLRAHKARKAENLVEESYELSREGRLARSFETAREAFDLAPENPEVMRLMGSLMKGNPQSRSSAAYFYRRLRDDGEATPEDKIALAGIYLASGQESEARALIDEVSAEAPRNPALLTLLTRLDRSLGTAGGSGSTTNELIRQASTESSEDPAEKLALAKAQISSSSPELRVKGSDAIWELAEGDGPEALEALELLAATSRLSMKKASHVMELLRAHPDAQERHQLAATALEIRIEPARRGEIIAAAVKERLGQPVSELGDFLGWLMGEGETGWILDLLPFDTAKKHPTALAVTLEAMAREGQWERLKEIVAGEDLVLPESRRALLLTNCAIELDEPEDQIRRSLTDTINIGARGGDFQTVAAATQLAETSNYMEVTQLGLSVLATSDLWRDKALMGYYHMATKEADSAKMLETARDVLAHSPSNETFQHIVAYLQLLRGDNIEIASQRAYELANVSSPAASRKMLLALGRLRVGDLNGARAACDEIEPADLKAGPRAIYAWIIYLTGDVRPAVQLAQKIPDGLLMAEERTFVRRILGRL